MSSSDVWTHRLLLDRQFPQKETSLAARWTETLLPAGAGFSSFIIAMTMNRMLVINYVAFAISCICCAALFTTFLPW